MTFSEFLPIDPQTMSNSGNGELINADKMRGSPDQDAFINIDEASRPSVYETVTRCAVLDALQLGDVDEIQI